MYRACNCVISVIVFVIVMTVTERSLLPISVRTETHLLITRENMFEHDVLCSLYHSVHK